MKQPAHRGGGDCRRPHPILMIPLRRCGSHALRLRLNFSPEFYSPYPLHIVDFMPLVPLYGDLADDKAYFSLVVDVIGLQAASMVKWPGIAFDPVAVFDALCQQPRSVHRVVWELLLRAGKQQRARVVMDKSLDSVRYADELMALMPDMRFLNVVRDPRAQVASMNRAIIHEFDSALNARAWVDAHRAGAALAERYPQRVLTIRYEDFLADQECVLRRVCDFFGIEFLAQMLDVTHSPEAQHIAQLSALWSSNCYAPLAANQDKFRQQLPHDEIEMIETIAADDMRRYGYAFLTDAAAAPPDADGLRQARARSEAARHYAWQELERNNPRDFILRRFRADLIERTRQRLTGGVAA